jgi:hypothetical protein
MPALSPPLGPYQQYMEALSASNPGLKRQDRNETILRRGNALVVLLDADSNGPPGFGEPHVFKNSAALRKHLIASPHDHGRRRIYIMEGLAPDSISALGGHFFMEPDLFIRQLGNGYRSNSSTPVVDFQPLPSLLNTDENFYLQYHELIQFNMALENRTYSCERTGRIVSTSMPRYKEGSTVGVVERKINWWARETMNGGWDGRYSCVTT